MSLLARFAESTFWMARYIERAENLARILDVNETFARDSRGAQEWLPIVQINADEERFFAAHESANAEAVVHFYVLDKENPSSIVSALRMARDNARGLRHLISTEMWTHLNVFYNDLSKRNPKKVTLADLSRLCAGIKENCQTHTGITEGTFYRDQGWYFYRLGKNVERADQITRLLDIKYHRLLPSPGEVGSPLDASQWNAVLRSAAGYHAFRRVYPHGLRPADVAGFLLFDTGFPRSVTVCLREIEALLAEFGNRYGLEGGPGVSTAIGALAATFGAGTVDEVIEGGLHEFLDRVQLHLTDFTDALGVAYFGHEG
jgi:uncharacterized alpha-E superfamily protein